MLYGHPHEPLARWRVPRSGIPSLNYCTVLICQLLVLAPGSMLSRAMRCLPACLLCCLVSCSMGFSQWGAKATKSACTHKSTKMALTQLNQSLADDLKEAGIDYIGVHNLSPGGV